MIVVVVVVVVMIVHCNELFIIIFYERDSGVHKHITIALKTKSPAFCEMIVSNLVSHILSSEVKKTVSSSRIVKFPTLLELFMSTVNNHHLIQ